MKFDLQLWLNIYVDVCATTTTEGYTPLHLAARYNPYNLYESAAREDTDSDSGQITPGNYSDYTLRFRRRQSSEAAMTFLISITKVDVSFGYDRHLTSCFTTVIQSNSFHK